MRAPRGANVCGGGCAGHRAPADLSGMETSGNKLRKLEFLLAEALESGA